MNKPFDATCPFCDAPNNAWTTVVSGRDSPLPRPGDLSICADCHQLAIFGAQGKLRRPTALEYGLPEVKRTLQLINKWGKERRKWN